MTQLDLTELRARIDALDEQIQALINERAQCALEVAATKQRSQSNSQQPLYYRPEREAQILRNVQQRNQGPLKNTTISQIFREIISACLALEQTLTVAYLGPAGSLTHSAALRHFGQSIRSRPLPAISDVFREVEAESCDFGVVPIEPSIEGSVQQSLNGLVNNKLFICGEIVQPVHHHLLSRSAGLQHIERLYGHPQTLIQCREWLDAQLQQVKRVAVASNAEAAQKACQNSSCAALGNTTTASVYELPVLAHNIEDDPQSSSRFLVLGKQSIAPSGHDKTSLVLVTNKTIQLGKLLYTLTSQDLDILRIASQPSSQANWEDIVFIDIAGHQNDSALKQAIANLRQQIDFCTVLGSYPVDVLDD